jgi:hypothetical protein
VAAFLHPLIYKQMNDCDRKIAKKLIFKRLNPLNSDHLTSSSTTTTTIVKLSALQKLAASCGHTLSSSLTTTEKQMTLDE